MPMTTAPSKPDILRIIAWAVCIPVLSAWPFLSAMPLFTLLGDNLSTLSRSINIVMLVFGFWPASVAYAIYAFLRIAAPADKGGGAGDRGLLLGGYALIWTAVYLVVAFARP